MTIATQTDTVIPQTPLPQQMRALVLDGTGFDHLAIKNVPVPHPGPHQLLARVEAAGICTSLIKLIEQGPQHGLMYGWDVSKFPIILGDEGVVTLVQVGEALQERYAVGERYVIQPAVDHPPINYRERYRDHGTGVNKVAVGYTLAGHLAEYILVTEEVLEAGCLLALPRQDLPLAHSAMCEPLSCVVSAQDHHLHLVQHNPLAPRDCRKGLKTGGTTVIVGAGAMGRMHVDLAFAYEPRTIVVADFLESRLELVQKLFGARATQLGVALELVPVQTTSLEGIVASLTDHKGADDVIVAVGVPKAVEDSQHIVGRGAVLNLFGGLKKGQEVVGIDATAVHYREINITGSSGGSPWDMARTLELIAEKKIDPGAHIARIGDLEHAIDFLEMVRAQNIDGKAVVYPFRRTDAIQSVESWSGADEQAYLQNK